MEQSDRLVGVIGGMGPDATIDFMSRVLAFTPAEQDQDHIRMLVDHNPRIPSRQLAMRDEGEDPGRIIARMAAGLQVAGVDFLVMPCNLAHAWQREIQDAVTVPFISIVDESVAAALAQSDGGAIGVFTTPGCHAAGIYQRALRGHETVLQTDKELAAAMRYVERIKAGDKSRDVREGLRELAGQLIARGAVTLVAACTEFPLVLDASMFDAPFISSTDVLARKTVALALGDEPMPDF